jgi:hypothetical protein
MNILTQLYPSHYEPAVPGKVPQVGQSYVNIETLHEVWRGETRNA